MSYTQASEPTAFIRSHNQPIGWQTLTFTMALVLYAVTGSPTPDSLGYAEIITAALLLISISVPALNTLPVPAAAFLFYGMSIPLLTGVVSGHAPATIMRDLIPFAFLLMPMVYRQSLSPWVVVMIGVSFAVRSLLPYKDTLQHPQLWLGQPPADLLYLANSPEVLFSALYLAGTGAMLIWARQGVVNGIALILLASLPVLAMAVMMQRAGMGCLVLAGLIWGGLGLWLRPARTLLAGGILLLLMLPAIPLLQSVMGVLVLKTEMVGLNSRVQEWSKVLGLIGQSPWTMLFGLGWGMTFENPAVGNLPVNYTHSLVSALLLKSGLIGVSLFALYMWIFAKHAVPELFRRPVVVLALIMPLGIGLLFYASYKSLGFGLLLVLLSQVSNRKLEKNQRDMR